MKAYSQDLRERILRSVDLSRPRAEIMQLFGVSSATAIFDQTTIAALLEHDPVNSGLLSIQKVIR